MVFGHFYIYFQRKSYYAQSLEERDLWIAAIQRAANVYNVEDFYSIGPELGQSVRVFEKHFDFQNSTGQGRFSSVRLGTHKITGRKYAIKVIDKSDMDQKEREV